MMVQQKNTNNDDDADNDLFRVIWIENISSQYFSQGSGIVLLVPRISLSAPDDDHLADTAADETSH